MVIGRRVFDRGGKFRLILGPLRRKAFQRFLPGGDGLVQLREVVSFYVRDPLEFDVELILAPGETPSLRLARAPTTRRASGLDSWLTVNADRETRVIVPVPSVTSSAAADSPPADGTLAPKASPPPQGGAAHGAARRAQVHHTSSLTPTPASQRSRMPRSAARSTRAATRSPSSTCCCPSPRARTATRRVSSISTARTGCASSRGSRRSSLAFVRATRASPRFRAASSSGLKTPGRWRRWSRTRARRATLGKIDPVFGREREIRQIIDILASPPEEQPHHRGRAGVGKTALVEGLALAIVNGRGARRTSRTSSSWASISACSRPARA
jgi:hypothetical protein